MVQQHFNLDDFQEQIVQIDDRVGGIQGAIVIHSTALGPAAGGCRLWAYPTQREMLKDGIRLARGMTYKNALAGLPFGGGKAVFNLQPGKTDRRRLLQVFADAVEELGGRYVTAEDVGTSVADMRLVRKRTRYVSGLAEHGHYGGDPSPWTASTVFQSLVEAVRWAWSSDLRGVRVAVQGTGNVGMELCRLLHEAGASLVVSDINTSNAAQAADRFGAQVVAPDRILSVDADVFCPCALGGVLDQQVAEQLRATLICGAANNQLVDYEVAQLLFQRGVVYAPDFVVNSGGIISVASEFLREPLELAEARMAAVPERTRLILQRSREQSVPPSLVAEEMAREVVSRGWAQAA